MTLVVSNQGSEPVHLDEGEPLGALHPVRMIEQLAESDSDGIVSATQAEDREERKKKLFAALAVESIEIQPTQLDQLHNLVSDFTDLFALSNSELGRTTVVEHKFDTSSNLPVREPPPSRYGGK